ncbi:hypothetical protein [Gilvimarinus chinensis]|uniref:hypothetical protein n=1 Tax=Gilvimarinus chinensis TaxID=396005 RepID=UPI00035FA422|nr:hypothetical protein [Gilvimarinus chinensis]
MRKKLLPLAMLRGLGGQAGRAEAVHINSDGLSETLIYPYGEKLTPCPACRGYNLERQHCATCKGSGFILESREVVSGA